MHVFILYVRICMCGSVSYLCMYVFNMCEYVCVSVNVLQYPRKVSCDLKSSIASLTNTGYDTRNR